MKEDLFNKLIQQKAGSHEAPVPADAWENISKKKKKKRYVAWWWFTGIILLAGITIGGYFRLKEKKSDTSFSLTRNKSANQSQLTNRKEPFTQQTTNSSFHTTNTPIVATNKTGLSTLDTEPKNTIATVTMTKNVTDLIKENNHRKNDTNTDQNYISSTYDETGSVTSNKQNKKRTRGQTKFSITHSSSVENDPQPETAPLATIENIVPDTLKNVPPLTNQNDRAEKDSQVIANKKPDLLQKAPDNRSEKNTSREKKVLPHKKGNGFYVDLSITPFIAYTKNDPLISAKRITVTPMRRSEFTATEIRSSTEAAFAYTFALRKKISKKITAGTGLQYSFIKENVRLAGVETSTDYNVVKRLAPNNGSPFLFNDTISTISSGKRIIHATNSYNLVSIPLLVQYELMNRKKWIFSLVGGTYLNISTRYENGIKGEFEEVYANGESNGKSGHKFTADLFGGFRLSRRIGSKYILFAEPGIRYSLMKYDMQRVVNNKYIHRAGISLGVSWEPGK